MNYTINTLAELLGVTRGAINHHYLTNKTLVPSSQFVNGSIVPFDRDNARQGVYPLFGEGDVEKWLERAVVSERVREAWKERKEPGND